MFINCEKLESVTLPNTLTSMDSAMFNNCSSLRDITIPDSVTSIGEWVFNGCSSLTKIGIPESTNNIAWGAFGGCSNLQEVNVSENSANYSSTDGIVFDKEMSQILFYPAGIKDASFIPDSVTSIDRIIIENPFLESITIHADVNSINAS